jgi:hypothetical protein
MCGPSYLGPSLQDSRYSKRNRLRPSPRPVDRRRPIQHVSIQPARAHSGTCASSAHSPVVILRDRSQSLIPAQSSQRTGSGCGELTASHPEGPGRPLEGTESASPAEPIRAVCRQAARGGRRKRWSAGPVCLGAIPRAHLRRRAIPRPTHLRRLVPQQQHVFSSPSVEYGHGAGGGRCRA